MKKTSWMMTLALASTLVLSACPEDPKPTPDSGPSCSNGTLGCACNDGACNDGLSCQDNVCRASTTQQGMQILNAQARSCEILLGGVSDNTKVIFAETVQGKSIHQGDKLALSFLSKNNEAFGEDALRLENAPSDVQVVKSTCFDEQGQALSGEAVRLQQ